MKTCKVCGQVIEYGLHSGRQAINKTIKVPELGIEIETEVHDLGKSYNEIKDKIPKGWKICNGTDLIRLWQNKKYRDLLHLTDKVEWCLLEDNSVARFFAYSSWASLYCVGSPDNSDAGRGVRFFRKTK